MNDVTLYWAKIVLLPLLPLAAFLVWSNFQASISGHNAWKARAHPALGELNKRWRGYTRADAEAYWAQMTDTEARATERRYLRIDLCFPLIYGGATIAACLLVLYRWVPDSTLNRIVMDASVVTIAVALTTMFADWTENLTQLAQFARFTESQALDASSIARTSRATQVKLIGVGLAAVMIIFIEALLWMDRS
jgi:hypothetical protein